MATYYPGGSDVTSGVGLTAELCKSQKEKGTVRKEKGTVMCVDSQVAKQGKGDRPLQFGHTDSTPEGPGLAHRDVGGARLSFFASQEMKPQT